MLEDVLFIKVELFGLTLGHVGQVTGQSHYITRVDLHVLILVLRDNIVGPPIVAAGNVVEAIRVAGIRQDIVIVDGAQPVLLALVLRVEHQVEQVVVLDALETDPLLAHNLLPKPELSVLVLQDLEEAGKVFHHGHILQIGSRVFFTLALSSEESNDRDEN